MSCANCTNFNILRLTSEERYKIPSNVQNPNPPPWQPRSGEKEKFTWQTSINWLYPITPTLILICPTSFTAWYLFIVTAKYILSPPNSFGNEKENNLMKRVASQPNGTTPAAARNNIRSSKVR